MAATQTTRFIDVTRTYIPVNPNSFPDSLHEYQRNDIEDRVPVMAYKGYNFLPTAYGYKSFFGINQVMGIDALAERIDRMFVFQNSQFENVLIALCDSGIWYKVAGTSGAWTNLLAMPFDRSTQDHYAWTYAVINNDLYVYRQGYASYQKISSQVASPGIVMADVVPSFLNMVGQLGIFRAGGRLGFWDAENSTAWSSLDDFQDFTPSLETLAGSAVFSQIVGRIVIIRSHGDGFLIYCTKSIVFVREQPESLFQWEPTRIMDTIGIAYPQECVAAVPDSLHYVYTNSGLYRIKGASPELIIPEVTDYFKESTGPKYVQFLEGRYLAFQTLDPTFAEGQAQFTEEIIPATTITFPGANLNLLDAVADAQTPGSPGFCPIANGLSNGAFDQPGGEDPSVVWRPLYTAYLSRRGAVGEVTNWTNIPVATIDPNGIEKNMCPLADSSVLASYNTAGTGNVAVTGAEAYVDGNWTIERFVAAQSALWKIESDGLEAFLQSVLSRTGSGQAITYSGVAPAPVPATISKALIGRYPAGFTSPQFGFSKCEFWLTRYVTGALDISRVKVNTVTVQDMYSVIPPSGWYRVQNGNTLSGVLYPTPEAAIAAWDYFANPKTTGVFSDGALTVTLTSSTEYLGSQTHNVILVATGNPPSTPGGNNGAKPVWRATGGMVLSYIATGSIVGGVITYPTVAQVPPGGRYAITDTMRAYNEAAFVPMAPIPDTGYCTRTGWKDIVSGTEIGAGACTDPPVYPEGSDARKAPNKPGKIIGDDGTFCSRPFEPFIIPGTPGVTINWPSQSVTIPSGSFLLQDGSIEPLYPTFEGAFVYDTHFKKWGKYKGRHKHLLDYSPINTYGPSEQSYARFGIMGGIVAEGGLLYLFDAYPADSYITYGKIGYYRQGMTTVEEIRASMKIPCTGFVLVESSLEGGNLTSGLSVTFPYTNETRLELTGGFSAKWHNISFYGQFDIAYLEYRGIIQGKR